MTRAVEELNRRMLRARDAIDRAYAQPLGWTMRSWLPKGSRRDAQDAGAAGEGKGVDGEI